MKRILSMLLVTLMVLSLAAACVFSTSAALEGDWDTARSASDYEDEGSYCPAPGYHYDPELGFVIDPPVYAKENTPFVQMHTKAPVNLKGNNDGNGNSVSLELTVLDYAYDGGENKDQWICFTLNSQKIASPPNSDYGEGLCILIRGGGNGSAQVQPFYLDTMGKNWGTPYSFPNVEVPMNDDGQEVYTFEVKYVDGGYTFAVNGHWFAADEYLNGILDRACADGAYVDVLCQTGVVDSSIKLAITEWQGNLPVGDDSKDPEEDLREKAPIADSANIPANQPAVLWDTTLRDFRKISVAGGVHEINEDGSVHITIQAQSPYISFGIKSEVSYEAKDFPYIAVLTRNCWANSGNVFYCAGGILSAENNYSENWDIEDTNYGEWSLGIMDFSDYNDDDPDYEAGWEGRINSIRVGFDFSAEDIADPDCNNFDVAFIAAFRSPEEAYAFTKAWLTEKGYSAEEVTTEEPTTPEETTEEPTDPADDDTTAPEGGEEATTEAPKTEKACGGIIGAGVIAIIALGACVVAKKKD